MTKSGISRLRAVVRNATTGLAVLACFAPMPAMAQEETSLPVIGNAALPRDLTPLGMFLNADIVVKAVLIGLVIASVITWTVWLAKTIELIGVKRRLRKALSALGVWSRDEVTRIDDEGCGVFRPGTADGLERCFPS
jgi:biopolymer transport protein ExbB